MNRKIAALRVLCERNTATQFANVTKGLTVAQVSLHFQSVLAAALTNPRFVMAGIVKAMALQVGKARGAARPVLLTVPCIGREEREIIRRLVQTLTWQVSALVEGPDMPDASTVVRALISEWLSVTTLGQHTDPMSIAGRRRGSHQTKKQKARSSKTLGKTRSKRSARPRRKKPVKKSPTVDRDSPHPDFPDVSVRPIDWRPGRRGRPPLGATRNKNGRWIIPTGFRVINGKVHPPLPPSHNPASVKKESPRISQQTQPTRTQRGAYEREQPDAAVNNAEGLQQPSPKTTKMPSSSEKGTETESSPNSPSGKPP